MAGEPEQAILVGDSPTDLAAGRNAGLPVILVSYGYSRTPVTQLAPDHLIDNFSDLPELLEKI